MRTKGNVNDTFAIDHLGVLCNSYYRGGFVSQYLLSAALLLIMDRSFGTSFYLSDIFIQGEVLHYQGGSPVLFEHLFWFLGHPEVYIVLLPALGITSEVIATNSRKPIFGYRAMVAFDLGDRLPYQPLYGVTTCLSQG